MSGIGRVHHVPDETTTLLQSETSRARFVIVLDQKAKMNVFRRLGESKDGGTPGPGHNGCKKLSATGPEIFVFGGPSLSSVWNNSRGWSKNCEGDSSWV